eukprot:CAMPEP_0174851892 /NCGR_PEP_ID=MMETSP1114-20130205/24422_1 /TAXON_ID=312471 /ORGANISM="Neobodo designis, Strain CCAP 1951/1" /LENGTH=272 /DNA_ID=CAMNT_0016086459 /DNA_START=32 /DNA_END=847 /DNA_ORIENTATION=-
MPPKGAGMPRALSPSSDAASVQQQAAAEASLRDVVVEEMLRGRHPQRPIVSRIVFVGEIVAREESPKSCFEGLVEDVRQATNAADPLHGRLDPESDETVTITGALVEHPSHFLLFAESEPAHLMNLAVTLQKRIAQHKKFDGIRNVHIAFYTDDIGIRAYKQFVTIDAPQNQGSINKERRMEDLVVEALHGLLDLATSAKNPSMKPQQVRDYFANVKTTHPQNIPKAALVETCLSCGLFLTLDEYVQVFANVPAVVRPSEVVHPVEPPLKYE